MIFRLIIFLALNFGALAVGGIFTSKGVTAAWYTGLAKAPWTPPGWVFGAAWTTIMVCFSMFMAYAWPKIENKNLLLVLYTTQLMLNISWNPTFFYYHQVLIALIIISLLTVLMAVMLFLYWPSLKLISLFVAPYLIWLLIATSLNGYIFLKNSWR